MNQSPWLLVITSAAVAAVVSALATLVGQLLERRARKRELLLTKAMELAAIQYERSVASAKSQGRGLRAADRIVSTETYYQWLIHLFDHGRLPDDPQIRRIAKDDPSVIATQKEIDELAQT